MAGILGVMGRACTIARIEGEGGGHGVEAQAAHRCDPGRSAAAWRRIGPPAAQYFQCTVMPTVRGRTMPWPMPLTSATSRVMPRLSVRLVLHRLTSVLPKVML
ncbi:hypothetical protein QE438_002999 [Pseudoxanthomonas sp. SORGH_AS 997]|nr:hypothetical protein [Pseudoxanthomonas sp. SORGH_AS_0997]